MNPNSPFEAQSQSSDGGPELKSVLIFGAAGQLGNDLLRCFQHKNNELDAALRYRLIPLQRERKQRECRQQERKQTDNQPATKFATTVDLNDVDQINAVLCEFNPDIVINCAAYTRVDQAENEVETSWQINRHAPAIMARWVAARQKYLFHFSTDYVFDGKKRLPYDETDTATAINQYGRSKLAAERAIAYEFAQKKAGQYTILRLSGVYNLVARNFVTAILARAACETTVEVVNDQITSPTSTHLIAEIVWQMLAAHQRNDTLQGLYHLSAEGECSWFEFAKQIIELASDHGEDLALHSLVPINSKRLTLLARRPAYSKLGSSKLANHLGISLPSWQQALADIIKLGDR